MTGREEACIRLVEKVGIKGKRLLDIGCSFGKFPKVAVKMGAKEVYAIEPDPIKVKAAKKDVPKAVISQGYAGDLKFSDNKFDIVTLFDVIEHVPKNTEDQVFKEIFRVLRPKGYVLVATPYDWWVAKITDMAWYFGHRHYSRERLTQLLKQNGFTIKYFAIHGGFFEVIGLWVLYISKWIFRIPMPFEEWFDIRRRREFKEPGKIHVSLIAQKNRAGF